MVAKDADYTGGMAARSLRLSFISWRARIAAWRDVWRALDEQVLAARLGALLFLSAGVLGLALRFAPASFSGPNVSLPVAVIGIVLGALAWRLPWAEWPVDTQLAFPLVGFALVVLAAHDQPRTTSAAIVSALTLLFMVTGAAQRPGRCALLAPIAVVAMMAATTSSFTGATGVDIVFGVGTAAASGEAVALVLRRKRRAERRVRSLLEAVREMSAIDDRALAPRSLAELATDLLDAHAVAVLLRMAPRSSRLVNRATAGHPALASCIPDMVRTTDDAVRAALETNSVVVLDDAGAFVSNARNAATSIAVLPLLTRDRHAFGCVVVLWNRPPKTLSRSTLDAAALLAQEASRMFGRLMRQAQLTYEAHTDALTTLANRRTFGQVLERLAPGDAVVVIDLDHFKRVNDTLGHAAGDDALRVLAACLRDVARQGDTLARYGGEEFALILPGAQEHGARVLLSRLRRSWRQNEPPTTFSAGIAVHHGSVSPHRTLVRADNALYEAKHAGRDRDEVAPSLEIDLREGVEGSPLELDAIDVVDDSEVGEARRGFRRL